jgi:UDP-2-acetamido-3-amino-2,3-dideoxy-glucuronate N-acetyltransferase
VIDPSARIHASAEVEGDVDIGARTKVLNRAQIGAGATIGADCVVGRDVFIDEGVSVGDGTRIHNGALVYRGVIVEDAVFIGPGAIVTIDRFPRASAATGDAPADVAARRDATRREAGPSPVVLRRGCSIGAGAVVVAPAQVGSFATVGAGAVVTRDVPGHAVVAGSPARRVGWVCACGHRLHDSMGHPAPAKPERYAIDTDLVCATCGRRYGYVPDGETLEQRTGPRQAAPA